MSDYGRELEFGASVEPARELGMDTFIYWPSEDHVRQIEAFASEVVPAVREAVEAERSRA